MKKKNISLFLVLSVLLLFSFSAGTRLIHAEPAADEANTGEDGAVQNADTTAGEDGAVQNADTAAGENGAAQNADTTASTEPAQGELYPIVTNKTQDWPKGPKTLADTAVLMEADTGAILYAKGMDEKRYPASITKVMTTLLALENDKMDAAIKFNDFGVSFAFAGSSNLNTQVGEKLTLEQCLYAMIFRSANDVSMQVGEYTGGTMEKFADMMNARAKALGCKNTHFVNACGLHDDDHYTTAYDMALIGREALKNEEYRTITAGKEYEIPKTNKTKEKRYIENQYAMLWQESPYYYEYSIGGKTGFTDEAWNTLISYAEKDGERLVCVVLHCPGKDAAYTDTKKLFTYGYDRFQKKELTSDAGEERKGAVVIPKKADIGDLTYDMDAEQGKREISRTYTYHGYAVGTAQIVQLNVQQEETAAQKDASEGDSTPEMQGNAQVEQPGGVRGAFYNAPTLLIALMAAACVLGISLILLLLCGRKKGKDKSSGKTPGGSSVKKTGGSSQTGDKGNSEKR